MSPQRAVPTALKILNGNPGKRPLNTTEPQPERGIPTIPGWLTVFPIAVREWKKEVETLDKMGILTLADTNILATRCFLASEVQTLAWDIKKEGHTLKSSKRVKVNDGQGKNAEYVVVETTVANPKVAQLKQYLTEYRQSGSLLGLDPSSRSRLHVKPEEEDEFDKFNRRNQ